MKARRTWWIGIAAAIAAVGALIHVAAIFGGAPWFEFFGAPPQIVASARAGTWLAPVGSLVIAGLMLVCCWYAAATLGLFRKPPLHRTGLATIAGLCLLRGLSALPLAVFRPELITTFEMIASVVWFLAGLGFAVAFRAARAGANISSKPTPLRGAT